MNITDLLIDSHHGIYIPKLFAEGYDGDAPDGKWVWDHKLKTDLSDPDNEHYNEAWDDILQTAKFECSKDGNTYHLEQFDSDVWLVRDGFYMGESGLFNSNDEEVDDEGNVIIRMKCNQCLMLSINGVATHEHGCPNTRKSWVDGEWVNEETIEEEE